MKQISEDSVFTVKHYIDGDEQSLAQLTDVDAVNIVLRKLEDAGYKEICPTDVHSLQIWTKTVRRRVVQFVIRQCVIRHEAVLKRIMEVI